MLSPITEPLACDFFLRALLASSMVGVVCAVIGSYMVLGAFVVLRGLAFMGDALSHAAFPGVVVAYLLKGPFYIGATVAAIATAVAIGWVTRRGNLRGDTAIGVLFAGMFALGIFLFSLIPNYVGDLFGFLFGEVLGIGFGDLVALVGLAFGVLAVIAILWKELLYTTFDPLGAAASGLPVAALDYLLLALIAVTIVVSLQAVGVVLVVAMLITPAATAQLLTRSFARLLAVAVGIGVVAPLVGLYASYWLNAASKIGRMPPVRRIMVEVGEHFWGRFWRPLYDFLGGNPFAAMPSLHFATSLMAAHLLRALPTTSAPFPPHTHRRPFARDRYPGGAAASPTQARGAARRQAVRRAGSSHRRSRNGPVIRPGTSRRRPGAGQRPPLWRDRGSGHHRASPRADGL